MLLSLFVFALGAGAASAQEQAAGDEAKMMEQMMAMAAPSEAHKKLEMMAGTWTTKVKMWMDPAAPPQESEGVSENRMVLGGRWLEQRYEGTFMGGPFSGIGLTGYDNFKKQYIGMWMDTASTSSMMTTGTAGADGKTMTFTGTMDDPITGGATQMKEVVTIVDADHHNFEMWMSGADGNMHKAMEIQYIRKKS
ncbi:MAG: DUF1579 domain-containing protein [Candidatus Eiseniibacteriota bacterium]